VPSRLFTIASALSLLLCMTTACLWVRSYQRCDVIVVYDGDARTFQLLEAVRGRVELVFAHARQTADQDLPKSHYIHESDSPFDMSPLPHHLLGLEWGTAPNVPPWFSRPAISIPHGFVVFLLAILPAIYVGRRARSRWRAKHGHCRVCGYDLRASQGRCPECGTAIAV
jgi:hypothetical protein